MDAGAHAVMKQKVQPATGILKGLFDAFFFVIAQRARMNRSW